MPPLRAASPVPTSEDSASASDLPSPTTADSQSSLTTPRPGPSDPEQRSHETLSKPSVPPVNSSSGVASPTKSGGKGLAFNTGIFRSAAQGHHPRHSSAVSSPSPLGKRLHETTQASPEAVQSPSALAVPRPTPQKSVSFSSATSLPKPERRGSYGLMARMAASEERDEAEWNGNGHGDGEGDEGGTGESSSADESTAIVRTRKANYGTTAGADTAEEEEDGTRDEGTQDGNIGPGEEHTLASGGTVRKRKSSLGRGRKTSRGQRPLVQGSDGQDEGESDGWWRTFIEKYGSVELENKGSVARDHLALERTFLAWLRTSLSFASIGIAVTQLFRLNTSLANTDKGNSSTSSLQSSLPIPASSGTLLDQLTFTANDVSPVDTHKLRHVGKPLGATFLAISILILLLGFHRYFESQHYVIRGKFPASRMTIIIVSFVATALIVASLVVVLVVAPSAFEK